jgi:hypothetical protein
MKLTVIDGEFALKLDSFEDRKLLELAAEACGRCKGELEVIGQGV